MLSMIGLIVAGVIGLGFLWWTLQSRSESSFKKQDDLAWREVGVDGYLTLQLPTSFDLDSKAFQPHTLERWYGLEPSELNAAVFTYTFVRGSYTNAGGITIRPTLLLLQVFETGTSPTEISTPLIAADHDLVAVYRDQQKLFQMKLLTRDIKLDKVAAQALIDKIGQSVQITKPWKIRLEELKADYNRRFKDQRNPGE